MPGVDEVLVAKRAYEIWEGEGRPHGRDREHWLKAVAEFSASIVAEPVVLKPVKAAAPKVIAKPAAPKTVEGPKVPAASRIAARVKGAVTAPARTKAAAKNKK